jgi:hypothetical protein
MFGYLRIDSGMVGFVVPYNENELQIDGRTKLDSKISSRLSSQSIEVLFLYH